MHSLMLYGTRLHVTVSDLKITFHIPVSELDRYSRTKNKLLKTNRPTVLHTVSITLFRIIFLANIYHTHPFNGPLSGTTRVSWYQKGKTILDFTEATDSEWHLLGHMQVCTLLQTDNHASTPPLSFLQAGCPSCRPTNSVKALKARQRYITCSKNLHPLQLRQIIIISC